MAGLATPSEMLSSAVKSWFTAFHSHLMKWLIIASSLLSSIDTDIFSSSCTLLAHPGI